MLLLLGDQVSVISLVSSTIINSGATLRLVFAGASWATPTIDLSSVRVQYQRDDLAIASGLTLIRSVVLDVVLVDGGTNELTIDCHVTGNDGVTNSARNPLHDGFSSFTVTCDAGIATEGTDTTEALVAVVPSPVILAAGPVFHQLTNTTKPTRNYDPTDLATGAPSGLSIKYNRADVPRPGMIVAGIDFDTLAVPGIANPYMSGHFEWELLDTSNNPVAAYSIDNTFDPVYSGTVHPYTNYLGGEFRATVYHEGTVRLKVTAYWKTASGEQSATATQDFTVRDISWDSDYWIDTDNGDAANDGLDPWGLSLSGATYNTGTRTLTKVGGFTSYDHAAATLPDEPWKHYNFIYLTGGDFIPDAGTPNDWLKNQTLVDAGIGTDVLNAWTNSGADADFTGTGIDIRTTIVSSPSGVFLTTNSSSPDISRASTSNPTSMTVGFAIATRSGNTRDLLFQTGVFKIRQVLSRLWVDIQHSGGVQQFDTGVDVGGFNVRKIITMRFTQGATNGTLSVWVNGTVALNEVSTTTDTLQPSSNVVRLETGGVHDNVEMFMYESAITDAQVEEWEGYFAHNSPFTDSEWVNILDAGHTYKTSGPVGVPALFKIESKTSNDSIVLSSGQTLNATTGISSSSGPLADGDDTITGAVRARIKGGASTKLATWAYNTRGISAATVHPFGDGKISHGDFDTPSTIGSLFSATGVELVRDHGFLSEIDGTSMDITLGMSGNSEADTKTENWAIHSVRSSVRGTANLSTSSSSPSGNNSIAQASAFLGSFFDGSGSLLTEHVFTYDTINSPSGVLGLADWGLSHMGTVLATNSDHPTLDHHIYPSGNANHRCYSLMQFADFGDGNYNINTNASENDGITNDINDGVVVWRTEFANSRRGLDISGHNNTRIEDLGDDNPFDSMQVLECSFHNLSTQAVLYYTCNHVRFGYCYFWSIGDSHIRNDDHLGSLVVHNTKHTIDAARVVELTPTWNTYAGTLANGSSLPFLKWYDSEIHDTRTQPEVFRCNFTNFTASVANGSDITNVQVYVPNDTSGGKIIYDRASSSYKTIAEFETATGLTNTFSLVGDFGWEFPYPESVESTTAPSILSHAISALGIGMGFD